jgi:hypothetical protein
VSRPRNKLTIRCLDPTSSTVFTTRRFVTADVVWAGTHLQAYSQSHNLKTAYNFQRVNWEMLRVTFITNRGVGHVQTLSSTTQQARNKIIKQSNTQFYYNNLRFYKLLHFSTRSDKGFYDNIVDILHHLLCYIVNS